MDLSQIDESTALSESKERLAAFQAGLVNRVDSSSMTRKSGVPFKIFAVKELLLHRMTALTEAAINLYEEDHRVASFVLVRGAMETTGAICNLHRKCELFLSSEDLDSLDAYLKKALGGRRLNPSPHGAINALSLIDLIDKQYQGYRLMYDVLCEYAHPNHFGVLDAFGKFDADKRCLDLGRELEPPPPAFGLGSLLASLSIFEEHYNSINDLGKSINDKIETGAA